MGMEGKKRFAKEIDPLNLTYVLSNKSTVLSAIVPETMNTLSGKGCSLQGTGEKHILAGNQAA